MYAIAQHIPRKIRQQVADDFDTRFRPNYYCPLGAVLYLAADDEIDIDATPDTIHFTRAVLSLGWTEDDFHIVSALAARFMHDYDHGRIRNLHTALGIKRKDPA
jgi:hypothetical protein